MDASRVKKMLFIIAAAVAVVMLVRMLGTLDEILPEKIALVNRNDVALRMNPNDNALSLMQLNRNDKVEVLRMMPDSVWVRVKNGQMSGYIRRTEMERSARYKEKN